MSAEPTLARCSYCGDPVNPQDRLVYRLVVGWERKAGVRASGKHGGSDISLRQVRDKWACSACITRLQSGISPTQESLL